MARFALLTCIAGLLSATVGCAPQTRFRRSAVVPAVTRPVHTAPVEGVVELGGSATVADIDTDPLPEVGDPAMYVPELELEGHARFRVGPMALGLSGHFAWLEMMDNTAFGTPPASKSVAWGLGPQLSFSHRFGTSIVGIGAAASASFNNTPWAKYGMNAAGGYELREEGTDLVFLYRLAVAVHLHAHERLLIMGGPAVANHVENVGFSDEDLEGSTLTSNTHGFVPFIGLRYIDPSGFFAQAQMAFPVGFGHIDITPITGSFTLGVAFGEKPEPELPPEPEPVPMTSDPVPAVPPAPPVTYEPVDAPAPQPAPTPPPGDEGKYESAEPMP